MSDDISNTEPVDMLNALTRDQLEDILRNEYVSDEPDVVLIKRVTQVLYKKDDEKTKSDINAEWQEFQRDYVGTEPLYDIKDESAVNQTLIPTAPRKLHPSIGIAVAMIAVIVILSGTLTAYALGYDVFEAIATWTKETFSFSQQAETYKNNTAASSDLSGVADLQAALEKYGIKEKLAPTYIPEGYKQTEFYVEEAGDSTLFIAVLENAGDAINIQIRKYAAAKNRADYEKDREDPEIYTVNDIPHYIMTNMGEYRAIWVNGACEVNISGLHTKEDLKKMIASIYERK